MNALGRGLDWVDDRLGLATGLRKAMDKVFPDHWSFMLGEIALYTFVILVLSGIYLTFFFDPSLHQVVYAGPYAPLRGQHVSAAYRSVVNLSLSTRAGLVIRQMHAWAANIFIGAIVVHMMRIFFTGAFRKPRELNWAVGVTLLILAIVNGFLGYSLPDDLASGTGLRIAYSIILSIPLVGSYLASFVFGGNFPGHVFDFRFYILHVLIIPLLIIALIGAHLGLLWHQKHTQFRGKDRTNDNVVGVPMWPNFALKSTGFFLMIAGAVALLGGLVQINPVWLYGPYVPYKVTYAIQPFWFLGWLDGALRVMPAWETVFLGHMIPNAFYPAVLFPGLVFNLLYAWPFIEARITHENQQEYHLLDRPRDRPKRTALGAAVFTFIFVVFVASSDDILANFFGISLNAVLESMRILLVVLPPVVGAVTYRVARNLAVMPRKPRYGAVIERSSDGGYHALPRPKAPPEPERESVPVEDAGAAASSERERGSTEPTPTPAGAGRPRGTSTSSEEDPA